MTALMQRLWLSPRLDLRYVVMSILSLYVVLGITVLGFNRTPLQVLSTVGACLVFDWLFSAALKGKVVWNPSAIITGLGLSILINYGHNNYFAVAPAFLAIASKYLFTFKGKHVFNPALFGVVASFLLSNEWLSPAPAYQWYGIPAISLYIIIPGFFILAPKANRLPLVLSFLAAFTLQIALRSLIMKHYLPFGTLFWGTLSSPPFFLFTFFMITDPKTSPSKTSHQILLGIVLAVLDGVFHLFQSYHTFFYAAFTVGVVKLIYLHVKSLQFSSAAKMLRTRFFQGKMWKRLGLIFGLAYGGVFFYQSQIRDSLAPPPAPGFQMEAVVDTGIESEDGHVFERVDPRARHIAKWLLSITDGAASADIDNDGDQDLFLASSLKSDGSRNALYLNQGDFKFKRQFRSVFQKISKNIETQGLVTSPIFVDYDNDGDQDLFLTVAFASSRLFKNMLTETGVLNFEDVTDTSGLKDFTNAAAATFVDINKDGFLDLIVGNTIATKLYDYPEPPHLNIFSLPEPEYEGDRRMFHFMHESWHSADNGDLNFIYLGSKSGHFEKQDSVKWGFDEHRWTMAIGTSDFNRDGWTDVYFANDFGPDGLYLNNKGAGFVKIEGPMFGTVSRDTYKGMNVTLADFDRNGYQDVYVSNVHHPLQAEGSLLWSFFPESRDQEDSGLSYRDLGIQEQASRVGLLNESRFGWGATSADFNNDGWVDLAQANGMVDDSFDKTFEDCPDYWYTNEKLARSAPSIHSYIDSWGDIRGACIHGKEKKRMYVNQGLDVKPQFVDVADIVGLGDLGTSRGMTSTDWNNDGRVDLLVTSIFSEPKFYRNVTSEAEGKVDNWIGFDLRSESETCNRDALGTRVLVSYLTEDEKFVEQFREVQSVSGFATQPDRRLHFGLGDVQSDIDLKVYWCSSPTPVVYRGLKPGEYHSLRLKGPHVVSQSQEIQ